MESLGEKWSLLCAENRVCIGIVLVCERREWLKSMFREAGYHRHPAGPGVQMWMLTSIPALKAGSASSTWLEERRSLEDPRPARGLLWATCAVSFKFKSLELSGHTSKELSFCRWHHLYPMRLQYFLLPSVSTSLLLLFAVLILLLIWIWVYLLLSFIWKHFYDCKSVKISIENSDK